MFFNEDFYTNCSGVKHRKRKKKETQEDDIIALNHKVTQRFIIDIEETKNRLKKISIELANRLPRSSFIPFLNPALENG
jgi:hypothetical protein